MENTAQRVTQQFEGSMESLGDVLEVEENCTAIATVT